MTTIHAQQPTVIKAETMPAAAPNHAMAAGPSPLAVTPEKSIMPLAGRENISPSTIKNAGPLEASLSPEEEEEAAALEAAAIAASAESSGGFFGSLRKKMRSAAGIDSQFVNPYLGKSHSASKLPPYGQEQISPSPAAFPTSSMMPAQPQQYPFQTQVQPPWGDDFYYQQRAMMMMNGKSPPPHASPYGAGMPVINPGMGGGYYGGVPPQHRGPAPFLYPSNSLLDYAYSMHNPYLGGMGRPHYYGAGYHPFSASAMPVQDKRLLPERNYFSAVKDIWQTNLQ